MVFEVTIDGVDVIAQEFLHVAPGSPTVESTLQARSLFRCEVKDRTGSYKPLLHAPVYVTHGGVRIFGGVITNIEEGDWGDYKGVWSKIEAADFAQPLETMLFNGILTGTTLRQCVQELVTARLAPLGYSVHAAMAEGPAIGPLGYGFRYIRDIFDDLSTMTQRPWVVSPYKEILFAPPGAVAAPFPLLADNDTINAISVSHTLSDYVNLVWIHYGAAGTREVTDTWHGDSSTKLFPVTFPQPIGVVTPPPTVLINGVTKPVAVWGVDIGYDWYWRASDAALIQDFALPALTPADTLIATYVANFPGAVYAQNAAEVTVYGEHAIIEAQPSVFDVAQARQVAAGRLLERGGLLRRIHVTTHQPGLAVGQSVYVDVPERNITLNCLVLSVSMALDGVKAEDNEEYWRYAVELVEGTAYAQTWQKFWNLNAQTGSAQSGSGSVGPPPTTGGGGGGGGSSVPGPIYFGGDRQMYIDSPTWVRVPGFVDVLLDPAVMATIVIRCQSWVFASSGMTINVRLVSLSGTEVGIGVPTNATGETLPGAFQQFTATLLGTPQFYRLEAILTGGANRLGAVAGAVGYPGPAALARRRALVEA